VAQRVAEAAVAATSPHDSRRTIGGDIRDADHDLATAQQLDGHDRRGTRAGARGTGDRGFPVPAPDDTAGVTRRRCVHPTADPVPRAACRITGIKGSANSCAAPAQAALPPRRAPWARPVATSPTPATADAVPARLRIVSQ